jgi:membrane-associated phospholipid phosphatase
MAEPAASASDPDPQQVAFAQADANVAFFVSPTFWAKIFPPRNFPGRGLFEKGATQHGRPARLSAQKHWTRARPFAANPDLRPCVHTPRGSSYPSGQATFATATAIILAAWS